MEVRLVIGVLLVATLFLGVVVIACRNAILRAVERVDNQTWGLRSDVRAVLRMQYEAAATTERKVLAIDRRRADFDRRFRAAIPDFMSYALSAAESARTQRAGMSWQFTDPKAAAYAYLNMYTLFTEYEVLTRPEPASNTPTT